MNESDDTLDAVADAAQSGEDNPNREAANRLYQRLGFAHYETNVYRYTI